MCSNGLIRVIGKVFVNRPQLQNVSLGECNLAFICKQISKILQKHRCAERDLANLLKHMPELA